MTAINWVIQYLNNVNSNEFCSIEIIKEILEQAKTLEKQFIIDAYANGHNDGCLYMNNDKQTFEHGEAYYDETFK
jgi:hypothetical protein